MLEPRTVPKRSRRRRPSASIRRADSAPAPPASPADAQQVVLEPVRQRRLVRLGNPDALQLAVELPRLPLKVTAEGPRMMRSEQEEEEAGDEKSKGAPRQSTPPMTLGQSLRLQAPRGSGIDITPGEGVPPGGESGQPERRGSKQ